MGCDIHAYSERRDKYGWELTGVANGDRSYYRFGLIAGVRRSFTESLEPKGFPKEVSCEVETLYKEWEGDAHSASHLTLKELKKLKNQLVDDWIKHLKIRKKEYKLTDNDDLRIVFWFDN